MSSTLMFVLIAFALLALFAYMATRRRHDVQDVEQASLAIRSLDIEAFRNLVDPEDEAFLRANLPPNKFRKIRRARALAALAYVKDLSEASLQVARFGGAAQRSSDPAIAASGRQIANSAAYLRLRALEARAKLMATAAFPGVGLRPLRPLIEQYDHAAHLLESHTGLRRTQKLAS